MKRQYITPSVFCVKLDSKRAFMQNMSVNGDVTVEDGEGGWAREYNSDDSDNTDSNGGNIWDNAW